MNKPANDKKHETSRQLRVNYTDAERLDLGRKLAEEHRNLGQINADLDSVKSDFKARVTSSEAKITDFSTKVSNGFRIEEVKCVWEMDKPKKGKKRLTRLDTSEEIEVIDMTERDLQGDLPLDSAPGTAGVDGGGNVTTIGDKK